MAGAALSVHGQAKLQWARLQGRPVAADVSRLPEQAVAYYTSPTELAAVMTSGKPTIIDLPMPDGSTRAFSMTATQLLAPELATRYPGIRTYFAEAVDDRSVTAKLDYSSYGLHAMVFRGEEISFVDPVGNANEGYYAAHNKSDERLNESRAGVCRVAPVNSGAAAKRTTTVDRLLSGYTLRTYRLAVGCTYQYAQKVTGIPSPSKEQVLSKIVTTMNRVNGVYERELAVTMQLVANQDALIFTAPSTPGDTLSFNNLNAGGLMEANQRLCDRVIGDANYDIGHAFSTGAGGLSEVGVVCKAHYKAKSVTGNENPTGDGFDIDYVAHEIGHEFGSNHTFNNNEVSFCRPNAVEASAFEPGSGSTIMAYAGICTPDNVQGNSDDYFHAESLRQMFTYINDAGDVCAAHTATGNKPPGVPSFAASYAIPARTPFMLTAPAAHDSTSGAKISYCWEQWNLGDFGQSQVNTSAAGPLFRSFRPVEDVRRVFPSEKLLLNGITSNAAIDKGSGEKLPEVSRFMTFRLTTRSQAGQYGCFTLAEDTMHIDVAASATSGFTVTSQNKTGLTLQGYSNEQVTWNVAASNVAPVNAKEVDIFMSADGGKTWPYLLGRFPNNGSATVSVPNPDTNINAARFMVRGADNIFFNVNLKDFAVVKNFDLSLKLSPVPASQVLHIASDNISPVKVAAFNTMGRQQWEGEITGNTDIPVHTWARGIYIFKFVDVGNRRAIRKVLIQ